MNQSITGPQDLKGDCNSIDLSDINNSIASLQSQIVSIYNPNLITQKFQHEKLTITITF
jgi:hypothetical protein